MVMRMQHNLEQQIQARYTQVMRQSHDHYKYELLCSLWYHNRECLCCYRNTIGVSEEQLKEFTASFK